MSGLMTFSRVVLLLTVSALSYEYLIFTFYMCPLAGLAQSQGMWPPPPPQHPQNPMVHVSTGCGGRGTEVEGGSPEAQVKDPDGLEPLSSPFTSPPGRARGSPPPGMK